MARILDGKAIAHDLLTQLERQVLELKKQQITPTLAVILVGKDPASVIYVRNKTRACAKVGIQALDYCVPATISQDELEQLIENLNSDSRVHGILLQMPVPPHLDSAALIAKIRPNKDVDGLGNMNMGALWNDKPGFIPCTPQGIMHLLATAEVRLRGARAVIIGRSRLVGKPTAALLLSQDATVTICHSHTQDLDQIVNQADILVAAAGSPALVQADWIKAGATVIDVGINRLANGQLVGDIDFDKAIHQAGVITPVPGGVGPLTVAMLIKNTISAASK